MPIVSGLIVPKMRPTNHFGNIRWLKPVKPFANYYDHAVNEQWESQYEEEPEEPLGIMPKVTAIVFLVSTYGFLAFFDLDSIDFQDGRQCLGDYKSLLFSAKLCSKKVILLLDIGES